MSDHSLFMQPPSTKIKYPWKNIICVVDNPFGDFTSGEVQAMNRAHQKDTQFWRDEHQ